MKRRKLFVASKSTGEYDLVFCFNDKEVAIIPLRNEEDVLSAASYLVNAFNKAEPED